MTKRLFRDRLAMAVLSAFLLLPAPAFAQNREAQRSLAFAQQMLAANMPRSAIAYYRAFIEDYPRDVALPDARYGLAQALEMVGDTDSIDAYREFLRLHPADARQPEARLGLARALFAQQAWSEARAAYGEFVARHPSDARVPAALYDEATCLVKTGRPLDAIPLFRRAADSAPPTLKAEASFSAAAALWQAGKAAEAAEALSAVGRSYPSTAIANRAEGLIGDILYRQGRYEEAIRRYRRALEAQPPLAHADEILFWKSWAQVKTGDTAAGALELASLSTRFPSSRRALESLRQAATLFEVSGDTAAAVTTWEKVAASGASDTVAAEARYATGLLQFSSGDPDRALAALSEVQRLNTVFVGEAEYLMGQIEMQRGNHAAADALLRAAEKRPIDRELRDRILILRLDLLRIAGNAAGYQELLRQLEARRSPALASAIRGNAALLESQNDIDAALREYGRVVEKFPGTDEAREALYRRGLLFYQRGEFDTAEVEMKRFVAAVPARPPHPLLDDAWYWIGFARFQRNRMEGAIEAFRAASEVPGGGIGPSALFRAGNAAYSLQKYDDALLFFNDVVLNSEEANLTLDALFNKAETLRALGRAAEARPIYLEAWHKGGEPYEQALLSACVALDEMGQAAEAAVAFENAVDSFSALGRKEEALMKAAALRRALGDAPGALSNFERVVSLGGAGTPDALVRISELKLEDAETEAARAALRQAADGFPSTLFGRRAALRLAVLDPAGDSTPARLLALIDAAPEDPAAAEARVRLGVLALVAGRVDSAVSYLRAALPLLSEGEALAEARTALGGIYVERRQYAPARTQLEYIYRSPLFAESRHRARAGILLGTALKGLNQRVEALKVLSETADKYPEVADEAQALIRTMQTER